MNDPNNQENPGIVDNPQPGKTPTASDSSPEQQDSSSTGEGTTEQQPATDVSKDAPKGNVEVGGGNKPVPDLSAPEPPPESSSKDADDTSTDESEAPEEHGESSESSAQKERPAETEQQSDGSDFNARDYNAARQRIMQSSVNALRSNEAQTLEGSVGLLIAETERAERLHGANDVLKEEKKTLQTQLAQSEDRERQLQQHLREAHADIGERLDGLKQRLKEIDLTKRFEHLGNALETHFNLRGKLGQVEGERNFAREELQRLQQQQQNAPARATYTWMDVDIARVAPWVIAAVLGGIIWAQWSSGTPETATQRPSPTATETANAESDTTTATAGSKTLDLGEYKRFDESFPSSASGAPGQ